jgi:hypothetical protein
LRYLENKKVDDMRNIIDYIEEPRFKSLMLELSKSNNSEDVDDIIKRYNDANGNMTEEEKASYGSSIATDIDRILKAVDDDLEALKAEKIRSAMGELGNAISFAYIAKHYFGKSQSWLTQRLNGSTVNGKTARFNKTELIQFQNAIHDLGRKLSSIVLL